MVTCADTSFLFSLYAKDAHTHRALEWLTTHGRALTLSALNRYELGNALRFAEFRKYIGAGDAALFLAQFEADRASGRLVVQICNLGAVIAEAERLSASHTLAGGHRGFDILHVASALSLGAKEFLTFDLNQKKLAESEGLSVPL